MRVTFKLCSPSLERYRALRLERSAKSAVQILPFPTVLWSDEYPKGESPGPTCHPRCRCTFEQLLLARHEIWMQGNPAWGRKKVWRQAKKALPEWPGFARCETSAELLDAIRSAENQNLDFFKVLEEWADSMQVSPTGFTATKKL